MSNWSLSPQYKKSAIERMFFFKDGHVIEMEQGFRWATFTVESDERPLTDDELKNEDGYELSCIDNDECWEMQDMIDGCWLEISAGRDTTEEELEAFEAAWDADSFEGVEALGWSQDECEYYYHGPLLLTNTDTGEEFKGEKDEEDLPTVVAPMLSLEEKLEVIREIEEEKSLLTPWYPASINPYRIGTYQTLETEMEVMWPFASNVQPAVWDGSKWDKKAVVMWRGLTEEVK